MQLDAKKMSRIPMTKTGQHSVCLSLDLSSHTTAVVGTHQKACLMGEKGKEPFHPVSSFRKKKLLNLK